MIEGDHELVMSRAECALVRAAIDLARTHAAARQLSALDIEDPELCTRVHAYWTGRSPRRMQC